MTLEFIGSVIAVENLEVSRKFYEELLERKVKLDLGECLQFDNGLTLLLKTAMTYLFGVRNREIMKKSNNLLLYFETDNFPDFAIALEKHHEVDYLQDISELPWGQKSVSFYDPDQHAVTVSESMRSVCRRLAGQGLTPERIAEKTEHPLAMINNWLKE